MKYLHFNVVGQSISSLDPTEDFTSGTVGEYGVQFTFSDDWDGYGKTVVFQMASYYIYKQSVDGKVRLVPVVATDAQPYETILVEGEATVPWEVLTKPGMLRIGVYGTDGDNKKPTVWANTVQVWPGTTTDNELPSPPSPSSYDILAGLLSGGRAGEYIYKKSDDDLDFAWESLPKGDKGDQGEKGDPGVGIASIVENADKSITITLDDGTVFTTDSLQGERGEKGETGDTGNGIARIIDNGDSSFSIYMTDGSVFTTPRLKGDKGEKGAKGDTGNGISGIVMNSNYTITFVMDDGTSYTTAPVRGEKGEKGDTGNGIQSVLLNPNYTLTIFYTDGTNTTLGPIRGEKGEKGDKGDKGDPGTSDYNSLINRPRINGYELVGNKSGDDLGLVDASRFVPFSTEEIETITGWSLSG